MFTSLQCGYSLTNSALWKLLQVVVNILGIWLPVIAFFNPDFGKLITPEILAQVATALAATNAYLTIATSAKIGV